MKKLHSIFAFTGTKFRLLDFLKANIKFEPEKQVWAEPFCGSCVVGLNFQPRVAYFNDINKQLIAVYNFLRKDFAPSNFEKEFEVNYISKLRELGPDFYYQQRQEFNEKWKELEKLEAFKLGIEFCANELRDLCMKLMFATQSSFSHQLRYNTNGGLNMAYSKFNYLLDETVKTGFFKRVNEFASFIKGNSVEFSSKDWDEFLDMISCVKQDMFVYCDPPYVDTAQDYVSKGFDWSSLRRMVNKLEDLGFDFAISGSCLEEDKEKVQDFFSDHSVVFKEHKYTMNSKGQKKVSEYLVIK